MAPPHESKQNTFRKDKWQINAKPISALGLKKPNTS